jgi:hypothetical protein
MSDYSEGKIYKIYSNNNNNTYYGSTTKTLNTRIKQHNSMYKRSKTWKGCTSFDVICGGDANTSLVEKYPCNSKYELELRESYYIKTNKCVNKKSKNDNSSNEYINNEYYSDDEI